MKLFKKTETKKQANNSVRELIAIEQQIVGGGINPQPLPPCHGGELKL